MNYAGMTGSIELGTDRMSRAIAAELGGPPTGPLPVGTILVLQTCEAQIPQRDGGTWCQKISVLVLAPCLAKTPARRRVYGVTVSY
jgi:hypothetical protein